MRARPCKSLVQIQPIMAWAFCIVLCGVAASIAAEQPAATAAGKSPPWTGNRVGMSDEVLPPWTRVKVEADRVSVWGRSYRFDGLPLPAAVVTRDAEVLAGPITLAGSTDGKKLMWSAPSSRVVQSKPHVVELTSRAEAGDLVCEGKVAVEYDGMVRCDLQLMPKAKKVTIDRLALEIPLRAQHALYLHTWPGSWGTAANSRALGQDGHRGPFKPFVWLGDHVRGLAWFAESDRNFFVDSADRVLDIRREGDAVLWRISLISKPQTIDRPLDYTFGFQATPVKPASPDAWDHRIVHMGNYGIEEQPLLNQLAAAGVRTICFHEHWTDIQNYPRTTHGGKLHKLVRACHERNIQLLVYFGYEMSDIAPEWNRYHQECLVAPRAGGYKRKPPQTAYIVCYKSHWQDFLAQGIDRVLGEYKLDGVYLDGTSEPWGCSNRLHGCGYVKPDGKIGTTYSLFNTRQMMRRIYTIVKGRNPRGQVNVHQSTCMTIPTLAFATSYWDGEQLQGVKRPGSPLAVLPLDAFCAEFMGHNWGVPAELLWYAGGPFRRVEAEGLGLLHDIPTRPGSMADVALSARLWRTRDAFGCQEATWIPYWETQSSVRVTPPGVKVSFHNRPGKGVLAVIFNAAGEKCQADVSFDLSALRQPATLRAVDVLTDKPVVCEGGRISVPLGSMEYAVIWLKTP